MNREDVINVLKETGVMLEGHFLLTSGKHSDKYMQCAQLFQYPQKSLALCSVLAERFSKDGVDLVVGPAVGGIIIAYQVAACLGVRNIFAERENGIMKLRRGFTFEKGVRALICEDVVTTGGSVKEVMALLKDGGAEVVGVGAIVDRSGGKVDFGCRFESVIEMDINTYEADSCPLCASGSVAVKPGSRNI